MYSNPHKVLPKRFWLLLLNFHFLSLSLSLLQTAQSLLRNPNGQYSSFDMAQYVFWTGDETGVARAVEELIDENLVGNDTLSSLSLPLTFFVFYLRSPERAL